MAGYSSSFCDQREQDYVFIFKYLFSSDDQVVSLRKKNK